MKETIINLLLMKFNNHLKMFIHELKKIFVNECKLEIKSLKRLFKTYFQLTLLLQSGMPFYNATLLTVTSEIN